MKKERSKEQQEELKALVELPDEDIDFSDIAEITDWRGTVVGKFYRPIKQPVSMRLDADIITWLKHSGKGYQSRINALLRAEMQRERQKKAA